MRSGSSFQKLYIHTICCVDAITSQINLETCFLTDGRLSVFTDPCAKRGKRGSELCECNRDNPNPNTIQFVVGKGPQTCQRPHKLDVMDRGSSSTPRTRSPRSKWEHVEHSSLGHDKGFKPSALPLEVWGLGGWSWTELPMHHRS